jgi:hypothetical protein
MTKRLWMVPAFAALIGAAACSRGDDANKDTTTVPGTDTVSVPTTVPTTDTVVKTTTTDTIHGSATDTTTRRP